MDSDDTNPSVVIAPNLFLNLRPQISSKMKWELRSFAAIGVLLQSGVLIFSAFATYHPKMGYEKEGKKVDGYGFPLAAVGTVILVFGMWICSVVVEKSSIEETWVVQRHGNDKSSTVPLRLVWLQQGGAVTDQQFDSYAIFANEKRESIMTSRLSTSFGGIGQARDFTKDDKDQAGSYQHYSTCKSAKTSQTDPSKLWQVIVTVGTAISVFGFIAQFTGLRFLHFSATVAQLVVTLIMAVIRAWVRRGLAFTPSAFKIPQGFELDWLAPRLLEPDQLWPAQSADCSCGITDKSCRGWGIKERASDAAYNFHSLPLPKPTSHAHKAMKLRERIGQLSKWTGPVSAAAIALSSTIEVVMDSLFQGPEFTDMAWTMQGLETSKGDGTLDSGLIFLSIRRFQSGWKSSTTEIEALLSLWLFSIRSRQIKAAQPLSKSRSGDGLEDWLRQGDAALTTSAVHLIGATNQSPFMLRDLRSYLGDAFEQLHTIQIASSEGRRETEVRNIVDASLIFSSGDCGTLALDFLTAPNMRDVKLKIGKDFKMSLDCVVGTIRETSVEKHLFQAMFSAFFWAVARKMQQVGGNTTVTSGTPLTSTNAEPSTPGVVERQLHLDNKSVSKLAGDIQRAAGEWLGDTSQVLWCIIPQLSKMGKLPEADEVIEYYRELARPAEAVGNYSRAITIYGELAEHFSTSTCQVTGSRSRRRAVGVIFNLYYNLVTDFIPGLEEDAKLEMDSEQASSDSENYLSSIQRLLPDFNDNTLVQELALLYHLRDQPLPTFLKSQTTALVEKFFEFRRGGFKGSTKMHLEALDLVRGAGDFKLSEHIETYRDSQMLTSWHYRVLALVKSLRAWGVWGDHKLYDLNIRNVFPGWASRSAELRYLPLDSDSNGWGCFHYLSLLFNYLGEQYWCESDLHHASDGIPIEIGNFLRETLRRPVDIPLNLKGLLNAQDFSGFTPLHYAKTEYSASFLIRNGTELDTVGRCGSTALHLAVRKGTEEIVALLLNCGANPNVMDKRRRTPLHWAAYYGYTGICRILRERGAILSARDIKGRLPLHLTRASHFLDEELWNILSSPQDEGLLARDLDGRNILHIGAAADTLHPDSIALLAEKYNASQKQLVPTDPTVCKDQSHTELIDILDESDRSAVTIAVVRGNTSAVSLLIDHGSSRGMRTVLGTQLSPLAFTTVELATRRCPDHARRRLLVAICVAIRFEQEGVLRVLLDRCSPDTAAILNTTMNSDEVHRQLPLFYPELLVIALDCHISVGFDGFHTTHPGSEAWQ